MSNQNYIAVDLADFRNAEKSIGFDVFLKIGENNYAHVFSKQTGIDFQRLNAYQEKGVKHLFIKDTDQKLFDDFKAAKPENLLLSDDVPETKKAAVLLNMAEQHLTHIFTSLETTMDLDTEAMNSSTKLVKNFIKVMTKNPRSLTMMVRVASHGDYLYYHSLFVSVVSMFLAKASVGNNPRMIEVCGLGGLLHDIGYTQLPRDLLEQPTALTPAQWKEMRKHTHYALKMVEGLSNIPDEVRFVLAQHHEEPRGTGYPAGIRGPVIFFPAKVVALSDGFCALVSKRPYRPAFSVDQALNIICHENGKWDAELIKILTMIFKKGSSLAA
jgi:putative nucleotidyltransferase with HDIG domain